MALKYHDNDEVVNVEPDAPTPHITPLRINLRDRRVTPLRINLSQLSHPTVPQPQVVSPIRINRSHLQVVSPLMINRSRILDSVEDSPTQGIETVQTGLEEELDVSIIHGDDTVEIIPGKYSVIPISYSSFQPLIF